MTSRPVYEDDLRSAVIGNDPELAQLLVPPEIEGVAPAHAIVQEVRPDRWRIFPVLAEAPIAIERAGHHFLVPPVGFDLWVADKIIMGKALVPWHRPQRRDR